MSLGHGAGIVRNGLVLHLDAANAKSYPGSLGSELVSTAALTAVGGSVVTITTGGVSLCSVVAGNSYVLRYTVSAYRGTTSGTFRINLSAGNYTPSLISIGAVGTYYKIFTANVSGTFSFYPDNTGVDLDLDFVSVREMITNTGTSWYDISGNNNNGSLINGVGYSVDNTGSMVFDGVNDYVNLNFPLTQSSSANSYTVVLVAKLSNISAARRQLLASDDGGFDWGFGAGDSSRFTIFSGENIYTGRLQDTNWHIFTAQWSSFGTRLYIDNVLDISTSNISYDSSISATISIGRNPGFGEYWDGNIANTAIYNRALSAAEIKQNFEALRGRYNI